LGSHCLRARVLPYLSEDEMELLRRVVCEAICGQPIAPVRSTSIHYASSGYIFHLAAVVGAGEELTKVVESLPGAGYATFLHSHKAQDLVFGLPSAALVTQHMRRLGYRLTTPHHVRAWLAHTELG